MNYLSLLFLFLVCGLCQEIDLTAQTIYGNITGGVSASGRYKIWNTRYAQSPAGDNRWKSPIPLTPWSGTIDASQNPPICPQSGGFGRMANASEDCLFVSIYAPIKHSLNDAPLPVQVYIHGGSFVTGGAIFYNGEILAGTDIIFVSINYRLGALGFLSHEVLYTKDRISGVGFYGIQDQRAALQWVQDNINFFGGDKTRVTVSGESAGAISICTHFALPKSNGLFSQAIMESGFCNGLATNETAIASGQQVINAVNCSTSPDVLSCLLSADATQLNEAATMFPSLSSELTQQPIEVIKSGGGFQVPLLIGTNENEYSLFLCPTYSNITEAQYEAIVGTTFPAFASYALKLYPASSYATPIAAYVDMGSDFVFKCPTKALSDQFSFASSTKPVYMYSFKNQPSYFQIPAVTQPLTGTGDVQCLGASHSFELPYLFDIFSVFSHLVLNETEQILSTTMRNAWVSFVTDGAPILPNLDWPKYVKIRTHNHT